MVKFSDEYVTKLADKLKGDFAAQPGQHLTDEQLLEYALGDMSEAEKDRLDTHFVTCETCTEAVEMMLEAADVWDAGVGERVLANAIPVLGEASMVATASRWQEFIRLIEAFSATVGEAIIPRVPFVILDAPDSKWDGDVIADGRIAYKCRRGEDDLEYYFYAPIEEFVNTNFMIEIRSEGRPDWDWQGEIKFLKDETVPGMKASAYLLITREERIEWPDDARVIKVVPKRDDQVVE